MNACERNTEANDNTTCLVIFNVFWRDDKRGRRETVHFEFTWKLEEGVGSGCSTVTVYVRNA